MSHFDLKIANPSFITNDDNAWFEFFYYPKRIELLNGCKHWPYSMNLSFAVNTCSLIFVNFDIILRDFL